MDEEKNKIIVVINVSELPYVLFKRTSYTAKMK